MRVLGVALLLLVCVFANRCRRDADCTGATWCRLYDQKCLPYIGKGQACDTTEVVTMNQRCAKGLRCSGGVCSTMAEDVEVSAECSEMNCKHRCVKDNRIVGR